MSNRDKKSNTEALLTLSCFGKIGPRGLAKIEAVSNLSNLRHLGLVDFVKAGIKEEVVREFVQFRETFNVQAELHKLAELNIQLVARDSLEYPPLLQQISDPPYLLYVLGSLKPLHRATLAVVGSRRHSHYSESVVERLIPLLSEQVTIVSGLAMGVDGLAHKSTLSSAGLTVAVVACGLDVLYPSQHRALAKKIIEGGGAIVSEYPPGTPPLKQHFPARNRIISGVSQGTLVIECDVKSGAMITAHHALDQNRDVYAVPGPITSSYSSGPNMLLRMGASVVTDVKDILEVYGVVKKDVGGGRSEAPQALPQQESAIFTLLGPEPVHIDALIELSKLDANEVGSALLFFGNERYGTQRWSRELYKKIGRARG